MTELPKCWARVPIVDVLELNGNGKPFQQGWSPQCERLPAGDGEWGVLRTTAIQNGEFWDHENKRLPADLEPRPQIEVKQGDVLMTCAGPRARCGVVCLVERTRPKLMMSGKMYRFRPQPATMHPKYLAYFIQSREAQAEIDRMKTGISDSGLNLTHDRFAALDIPVAPYNEQCRIVAKIDALFSELENGIANLSAAAQQISIYRQSVLKHAFEGKLTAGWRGTKGAQKDEDSPNFLEPREQEEEELASLPDGWTYVRLKRLTDPHRPITYGVIKLGRHINGGVPTLRSSDVRKLRIDTGSVKRIAREVAEDFRRTFLRGGEVLITVRGTLGGVAAVPNSLSGWNISREVALIAPATALNPYYLQYMLASPQLEAWFKARVRGVAYTGINLATLREAPVIFCSVEEQTKIADLIEEKLSVVDAAEIEVVRQAAKLAVLRQAILKKAFRGQLVEQDPADEPAADLLVRIKAEKVINNKKTKRKDAA